MKRLAPWAWVVVLGTALALSWWSLDVLALHFGVPKLLAATVSATFDGAALVAADLAMRRAAVADSALPVKLLMIATVGLSAWLNYQHGLLLGYPLVARMLFAAPSVIAGWLFELQLEGLYRERLHELDRTARPMPRFGLLVWLFHPWAALRRLSQIAASRLQSVPVTVMDWHSASTSVQGSPDFAVELPDHPILLAAPVESVEHDALEKEGEARSKTKVGRTPVPDGLYLAGLRELVERNAGVVPSIREIARKLSIGQDRARRLVVILDTEPGE